MNKNLLIEIGVEELPIASLESSAKALKQSITAQLLELGFLDQKALKPSNDNQALLVSPRRIAVRIENVDYHSKEKLIITRGPKQGTSEQIVEKFAKANHMQLQDLVIESTDRGDYYFAKITEPAKKIDDVIEAILDQALKSIASKKSMRWADLDYQFLRPIHWMVALHGDKAIKGKVWGIELGNYSYGHRFHHPNQLAIEDEKNYQSALKKAKVLVSKRQREQSIIEQILKHFPLAKEQIESLNHYAREVSNLVEWPVVLVGTIGKKYLDQLPVEVIETILFKHQFCFIPYKKGMVKQPMQSANQLLEPHFITVCNLESKNPKLVIEGYQKVITARLEDGLFFYQNDSKRGKFEALTNDLQRLVFHNRLGSYKAKTQRMNQLAKVLARDEDKEIQRQLSQAIELCKNDLLTQSVIEMPSLQGIFGAYLSAQIADVANQKELIFAIKDQYQPISRYDDLPKFKVGQFLALVDKLDSLSGLWLAGLAPKGSKDPFALRRTALAIIRLLSEGGLKVVGSIEDLIVDCFAIYQKQNPSLISGNPKSIEQLIDEIKSFIHERMEVYLIEKYQQIPKDLVQSITRPNQELSPFNQKLNINTIDREINAIADYYQNHFKQLVDLLACYKRVSNLIKNSPKNKQSEISKPLLENLLTSKEEKALIDQLKSFQPQKDLAVNLNQLHQFDQPIENFLENIQINCEDQTLQSQRQLLLLKVKACFDQLKVNFNQIQSI